MRSLYSRQSGRGPCVIILRSMFNLIVGYNHRNVRILREPLAIPIIAKSDKTFISALNFYFEKDCDNIKYDAVYKLTSMISKDFERFQSSSGSHELFPKKLLDDCRTNRMV